jgi:hypothetical protein
MMSNLGPRTEALTQGVKSKKGDKRQVNLYLSEDEYARLRQVMIATDGTTGGAIRAMLSIWEGRKQ